MLAYIYSDVDGSEDLQNGDNNNSHRDGHLVIRHRTEDLTNNNLDTQLAPTTTRTV